MVADFNNFSTCHKKLDVNDHNFAHLPLLLMSCEMRGRSLSFTAMNLNWVGYTLLLPT